MTNNTNYLPEYALNQLTDRVAMKLYHINHLYKADKVWDNVITFCQRIEHKVVSCQAHSYIYSTVLPPQ